MIDTKGVLLGLVLSCILAFAIGRYTAAGIKSTSETQTSENATTKEHVVRVTLQKLDGTVSTTETTDKDVKETVTSEQKQVQVMIKAARTNISVLAGTDFTKPGIIPLYGVSVSRELIGPVIVGVFGLKNGVAGLSIGVNF